MNLLDTPEGGAAYQALPKSHRYQCEFAERFPATASQRFFLLESQAHADFFLAEKGCAHVCIAAQPGDLVLWDLRTIHCGRAAARPSPPKAVPQPPGDPRAAPAAPRVTQPRAVVYVAMQPRVLASPADLKHKCVAFAQLRSTTHNVAAGVELFPVYQRVRFPPDCERKAASRPVAVPPVLNPRGLALFTAP